MQKGRIMIVEDERIVALDLQDRLRRMGFEVVGSFGTGEEAVARAAQLAPDLALMDVRLAGAMDGVQAAEEVRRMCGVPVVFLTAYSDDETLARVKAVEPLGYVLKPFEQRALQATIETALFRHRAEIARRDADAARRRAEARYAATLECSPDAIVSVDGEGRVVVFNRAAERMFGWTHEEVRGKPLDVLLPGEFREQHRSHVDAFRVTGGTARRMGERGRVYGQRRDGERFPAEVAISMLVREDETLLTAVVRDVTQQSVMEEQLRRAQQLEAVGMLASSVVHDVNNLLAVIQHATELIRRDVARDGTRELVGTITGAVARGAALTRQLLLYARRDTVEPDVVVVDDVLASVKELVQHLAGDTNLVVWTLGAPKARVRIDRQRLEQVVLNCVANARDAMPRGGTIEILTRNDGEGLVALEVRDTGTGIPPELRTRIFEPFFTTKEAGHGSGLGLWTVREVVREAGGAVELDTVVGRGTRFIFELPTTDAPQNPAARPSASPDPSVCAGSVLVVDDEQPLRELLGRTLQLAGFEVHMASDAGEALSFLAQGATPIDVLVTDFAMPIMTGPELAERMRRFLPGLGVVYMSGYADEARERVRSSGRDDVLLPKPFTGDDLVARVCHLLRARASS